MHADNHTRAQYKQCSAHALQSIHAAHGLCLVVFMSRDYIQQTRIFATHHDHVTKPQRHREPTRPHDAKFLSQGPVMLIRNGMLGFAGTGLEISPKAHPLRCTGTEDVDPFWGPLLHAISGPQTMKAHSRPSQAGTAF